jgi:pimeloyl-ACP methyl ester carboxylesterase
VTAPTQLTEFGNENLSFPVRDLGPLDGPVIIALHGFPQTASCWDAVASELAAAGYRVLAFDQRGYTPNARPHAVKAYRVDRLAGDVLALADAAGVERFHLIGHDWGGGIAWYVAARHAQRVASLTGVSTPHPRAFLTALPGSQALRSWYILLFQLPWLPEYLVGLGGGAIVSRGLRRSGLQDPATSVRLLTDRSAAAGMINWYRALRIPGVTPPGKVIVPTLHVWSDRDPWLGRRAAELTAKWVDGPYQFHIMWGVSHWIPEERPKELSRLVLDHLARYGGTESGKIG